MAEHLWALRGPCCRLALLWCGLIPALRSPLQGQGEETRRGRVVGMAATQEQAQKHSWSCTRRTRERITETTMVNQGRLPRCGGRAQHRGPQWAAESRRGRWEDHVGPQSRDEWGVGGLEGVRKDLAGLSISLFVCPLATGLFFHRDPCWTDR